MERESLEHLINDTWRSLYYYPRSMPIHELLSSLISYAELLEKEGALIRLDDGKDFSILRKARNEARFKNANPVVIEVRGQEILEDSSPFVEKNVIYTPSGTFKRSPSFGPIMQSLVPGVLVYSYGFGANLGNYLFHGANTFNLASILGNGLVPTHATDTGTHPLNHDERRMMVKSSGHQTYQGSIPTVFLSPLPSFSYGRADDNKSVLIVLDRKKMKELGLRPVYVDAGGRPKNFPFDSSGRPRGVYSRFRDIMEDNISGLTTMGCHETIPTEAFRQIWVNYNYLCDESDRLREERVPLITDIHSKGIEILVIPPRTDRYYMEKLVVEYNSGLHQDLRVPHYRNGTP